MAFQLSVYPWTFKARHTEEGTWKETFTEGPHHTPEEEAALGEEEKKALLARRNNDPELPLINYTTQYGMGCFEGMKAFPQKNGGIKFFRPDENAARMARSMAGLKMPPLPEEIFLRGAFEVVKRNCSLGFAPAYDPAWEKDNFLNAKAIYLRPFSYSEPAIGLGLSEHPWVVIASTPVGSYFKPGSSAAVTTNKVRAFPKGTGWIKCDANYVVPTLAKKEAEAEGYMEAVFLDARERKYVEEGSSCNIFFRLKSGRLITPALGDTILPGITRKSVLQLAEDKGITTEERLISIDEALSETEECFVTGTAAGISPLDSLTHRGRTASFSSSSGNSLTKDLLHELKGIQYGLLEDRHGWMHAIPE